MRAENPAAES